MLILHERRYARQVQVGVHILRVDHQEYFTLIRRQLSQLIESGLNEFACGTIVRCEVNNVLWIVTQSLVVLLCRRYCVNHHFQFLYICFLVFRIFQNFFDFVNNKKYKQKTSKHTQHFIFKLNLIKTHNQTNLIKCNCLYTRK